MRLVWRLANNSPAAEIMPMKTYRARIFKRKRFAFKTISPRAVLLTNGGDQPGSQTR